jgi:Na+-translocating ferredoxin:NAD+ oxidoreductase RnfE subunit
MLLAPGKFFKPESGTETLLMQTIGIRDVVLGLGACAAWMRGDGAFRGWATAGLISDSADLLLGLRSRPLVGTKSALIATLAPVPFVGAGLLGFARSLRKSLA